MTQEDAQNQEEPQPADTVRVMIVGAGIGGLMLAALLESASIEYSVFERAPDVKPLGKDAIFLSVEYEVRPTTDNFTSTDVSF